MFGEIVVAVNGTHYAGWKAADATCSMDSVCGAFDVALFDRWGASDIPREILPGDSCQVLVDDEAVLTGYTDVVSPSISPEEHGVSISGRDKTADLVDCSAELDSFEIHNQKLDDVARSLCGKFGIKVQVNTDVGAPFARFAVQPGETAFACIERMAKLRGVLCTTSGTGDLVLSARGEFESSGDSLVEEVNIKSGVAVYDFRDRFSVYKAHAQMPALFDGADAPVHNQIGEARDANLMRYRPLILTCDSWSSSADTETRAKNECAYRAGKSSRLNIQVAGWRQSGGALWRPKMKVPVISRSLYLDNVTFVIRTVRYSFSDSDGTIAELEMTRPDAYLNSGAGEVESDPFAE